MGKAIPNQRSTGKIKKSGEELLSFLILDARKVFISC